MNQVMKLRNNPMVFEKHILSKSTFMYGSQCLKRLYLHKKFPKLKDDLSAQQQSIFSTGTNVGELAQQLFPSGVDCTPESYYDFRPSINKTKELIASKHPAIYEAAFQFEQVLVALDILVLKEDGWHAYEVKSTNSTKDPHVKDAALQYWVITNSGLKLQSMNVMHFNPEYIRQGELDVQSLFTWDDITEQVKGLQPFIEEQVKIEKNCLTETEIPEVEIGGHCSDPYGCDFAGHCWKHVPNYSVFNLTRAGSKGWDLYNKGILEIKDIPTDYPLSDSQQLQVECERSGQTFIDQEGIGSFLQDLVYPLYFLDFETIMPAIPLYDQSKTYQMIVFQYSLHIQEKPGAPVKHLEFLAQSDDSQPRTAMIDRLILDIGTAGSILVYNQSFEASRLNEIARDFPKYQAPVSHMVDRMIDLAVPFQRKYYYTADMRGSYSIKKVLPALVPELAYNDLEIQEGGTASLTFLQMVQGQFKGDEEKTRKALLEYCKLDTLAMVRILEELRRQA